MSEATDLAVLEIKPEQAPALYVPNGLSAYLDEIRNSVNEVPDLSTAKGRARVASLAAQVSRSKTAIEKPGRDYLKRLKELPKEVEAELRRFVCECDAIRDETRRPLTEWEQAEDERKQALQQRLAGLRALADVIDDAGNYLPSRDIQARLTEAKAVTLDDSWQEIATEAGVAKDAAVQKLEAAAIVAKQREDQAAELERLRKEAEEKARRDHEEKLKREAAEATRREIEEEARKQQQAQEDALSEINGIQHQVIIAQSGRSGVRKGGTIECIRETLAETESWPIDDRFGALQGTAEKAKQQAVEQIKQMLVSAELIQKQQDDLAAAERSKQEAVDLEQRKAREEADRIKREADAKEATRLAEQKRIDDEAKRVADEAAARAANEAHRKTIGTAVVNALIANAGLTRAQAIEVLTQIKDGNIPHTSITY